MAQWVKYVPPKYKNLSSGPLTYVKVSLRVAYVCNLSAHLRRWEAEAGEIPRNSQASYPGIHRRMNRKETLSQIR